MNERLQHGGAEDNLIFSRQLDELEAARTQLDEARRTLEEPLTAEELEQLDTSIAATVGTAISPSASAKSILADILTDEEIELALAGPEPSVEPEPPTDLASLPKPPSL